MSPAMVRIAKNVFGNMVIDSLNKQQSDSDSVKKMHIAFGWKLLLMRTKE